MNTNRWLFQPLLQDIAEGVRSRPGRFLLSLSGMTVGMTVLVALAALLAGLQLAADRLEQELGSNVVAAFSENSRRNTGLTQHHADLLQKNYPGARVSVLSRERVKTAGTKVAITRLGVDATLLEIRQWQLVAGRFIDTFDVVKRRRNAVVTRALARQWQWQPGATILLDSTPYRVVGVVDVGGGAATEDFGDVRLSTGAQSVFVPYTLGPQEIPAGRAEPVVDAVYFLPPVGMAAEDILPGLKRLFAQPDISVEGVSWIVPGTLGEKLRQMRMTWGLALGIVGALCLVLGGTTLSTLLVANVRERLAEIGLRRALGATPGDITGLFVAEGCFACLVSAALGVVLVHIILAFDLSVARDLPLAMGWHTWLLPLLFALFLGVFFSWWPAKLAAAVRPADALRSQ